MEERLPPHDIDAEEAVIGSLLIDGDAWSNITGAVAANDFYSEGPRYMFEACEKVVKSGGKIDQITLAHALRDSGKLEEIGGAAYLSHLVSMVPTSLDIEHYAQIVYEDSVFRQMVVLGQNISQLGYEAREIDKSISKADELVLALRQKVSMPSLITPKLRGEMMAERYADLFDKHVAVESGLKWIDYYLGGGFFKGDLIILGARPGMGKTAFMQTISNLQSDRYNVLFCSIEMSVGSLTDRDIAGELGVSINQIRRGEYDDVLFADILGRGLSNVTSRHVYFLESANVTTARLHKAAVEMKLRYGLDIIYVDYLGLISDERGHNENERLAFISRRLKNIAREIDVPLFSAHQLSRAVEQRQAKKPGLSDLRESGHLEEDADVVCFLYRDDYYDRESEDKSTKFIIAKHRQGDSNIEIPVFFDKKRLCYVNEADDIRKEGQPGPTLFDGQDGQEPDQGEENAGA